MTASCRCGRRWTGLSQAHCTVCHEHFGSVQGFDRHRSTGKCVHPAAVVGPRSGRRVYRSADGPLGVTWVLASDRIHPGHARRLAEQEAS